MMPLKTAIITKTASVVATILHSEENNRKNRQQLTKDKKG
jgi:hypothetical protein